MNLVPKSEREDHRTFYKKFSIFFFQIYNDQEPVWHSESRVNVDYFFKSQLNVPGLEECVEYTETRGV